MTLLRHFIFIFVLGFICSCSQQEKLKLYLIFDNADGLTNETEIKLNGHNIGRVTHLQLLENKVLVSAIINDTTKIPKTSIFLIQAEDFMGKKYIVVHKDNSTTNYLISGDTIHGQIPSSIFKDSTLKIDSQTIQLLKPLVDTLAGAIRDLSKSIKSDGK